MKLSQVSLSKAVDVPGTGLGLRDGYMTRTPGIVSIVREGDTVVISSKTGSVLVPWSSCICAVPEKAEPAKK